MDMIMIVKNWRNTVNTSLQFVPPSPDVVYMLYQDYLKYGKSEKISFKKYLRIIGYVDPSIDMEGMDDGISIKIESGGPVLISVPTQPIIGELQVKVLLVDFADRPGSLSTKHYEDMLFSNRTYPTGSMRDYYHEVSLGKVNVSGFVHGWFRMPQPYSYYTNNESGTEWDSYPQNVPRLAEDAVNAALAAGIDFPDALDKLSQGVITALFIIHSGRGAEVMPPSLRKQEIWSHKWNLRNPVQVSTQVQAALYLTVPHDCKVGVCAHELGHLAFQWDDFYDPNYDEDGNEWDGSGQWDLMAGGSYNGAGARPAHPAGLHKSQHGWLEIEEIRQNSKISLKPYTSNSGKIIKIISPSYKPKQYLLIENRVKSNFDSDLPGEGLLIWRVDESQEQVAANTPALLLIQADGKHQLESANDLNQGDTGDPFPGAGNITSLPKNGSISTSFPNQPSSDVALANIKIDSLTGDITFDVIFD
jgi:immune inhibitor A